MKLIKKLSKGLFLNIKDKEAIRLDFNPFIEGNSLTKNFILLHWNRLFRQYGFYYSEKDNYLTYPAHLTSVNVVGVLGEIFPKVPVLPTACIIFHNAKIGVKDDVLIVEDKSNA